MRWHQKPVQWPLYLPLKTDIYTVRFLPLNVMWRRISSNLAFCVTSRTICNVWAECEALAKMKTYTKSQSVRPLSCHCCQGLESSWALRCWNWWLLLFSPAWTAPVTPPQWRGAPWGAAPQRLQWSAPVCRRRPSGWAPGGWSLWWTSPSLDSSWVGCCGPALCAICWCRGCCPRRFPPLCLALCWLIFCCDVGSLEENLCASSLRGIPGFSCRCRGWHFPGNEQCRWCVCTTLSLQPPGNKNKFLFH